MVEFNTQLVEYGRKLLERGFEVWITPPMTGGTGWLVYRNVENDCWGTLQRSDYEGWQHLMPMKPSREHGSSMYVENPAAPFSTDAAFQCAQPTNFNRTVGTQKNAKPWMPANAVRLESFPSLPGEKLEEPEAEGPNADLFKVEQSVRVWLVWDDEAGKWRVDMITMDGSPLLPGYDDYTVTVDVDESEWTTANREEMARAQEAALPTGQELAQLMQEAL